MHLPVVRLNSTESGWHTDSLGCVLDAFLEMAGGWSSQTEVFVLRR